MPLNPPPNIQAGLCLITQRLLRTDMSRAAEVTFAVLSSNAPSLSDAQDTVDDFQANFNAHFVPQMDSEVQVLPPFIREGDGGTVPFEAVGAGATVNGGTAGTFLPPNIALLFKKSTGQGGRQNRGRTYMPFTLADTDVTENGTVSSAEVAAANTNAAAFLAQLVTDGTPLVIANKVFNTPLPPHFVTHINAGLTVTSMVAEPLIATQRRRLGR